MAAVNNSRLVPLTTTLRLKPIQKTEEIVEDLKGLTMDKCDMLSKSYGYHNGQFTIVTLLRRERCLSCHKIINSKAAKKNSRKPNTREEDEMRLRRMKYFDWWPEGKPKPYIITSGGSMIRNRGIAQETDPWTFVKDGPPVDINMEQYYEPGEYEKALQVPKIEIKRTEENRHSIIPQFHERPVLGELMDPNRPCYTKSSMHFNYELFQWWNYIIPSRWSEYKEETRGILTVRKAKCIGHPGIVENQKWTCCEQPVLAEGCEHSNDHARPDNKFNELEAEWTLFETPKTATDPRFAVALSCEMGITAKGDPELVRISMVDFFTGATLIDSLVFPRAKMLHLNTRFSGVTWKMLYHARSKRTVLEGRDQARKRVWDFVGQNTIVIVHAGGRREMEALRWMHARVIDTEELESRRNKKQQVPGLYKGGLRKLTRVHLNRNIQTSYQGHDTLENAMACRDLAYWYSKNLPPIMKTKIDLQALWGGEFESTTAAFFVSGSPYGRYIIARNLPLENDNNSEAGPQDEDGEWSGDEWQ